MKSTTLRTASLCFSEGSSERLGGFQAVWSLTSPKPALLLLFPGKPVGQVMACNREEGILLRRTGLPKRIPQDNHRKTWSTLRRQEGSVGGKVAAVAISTLISTALKKQKIPQESLGSLLSAARKARHTAQVAPRGGGVLEASGNPAQMSRPGSPALKADSQPPVFPVLASELVTYVAD